VTSSTESRAAATNAKGDSFGTEGLPTVDSGSAPQSSTALPDDPWPASSIERSKGLGVRRFLIIVGLLAVAIVAAKLLPVAQYLLDFVGWIRNAGALGMVVYVAAYVAACVLFLPGSILTLGAGFAYGALIGVPLVWTGASIGATLAFILGRTLLRSSIEAKVAGNPRFAAIDRAVGKRGLKIVLLTRLSPVFPFNLLNYAFGLTKVGLRDYAIGTVVGIVPGTIMYVYLGSLITGLTELAAGKTSGGVAKQIFYFAGLAATVVVTIYVTRIARKALREATAGGQTDEAAKELK
jgi:uncharacterized membrane protein YdjX (TVP38/TMEM64 family)